MKKLNLITSLQGKLLNTSTSHIIQSDHGIPRDTSMPSELMEILEGNDDLISHLSRELHLILLMLKILKKQKNPKKISLNLTYIAESALDIKKMTSSDKSIILKMSTQNIKSSKILDQESTLRDQAFSNLSKELLKEISKRLWLPIKTDSSDSPLTLFAGSSSTTAASSWFSTMSLIKQVSKNSPKTCSPLYKSFHVDRMESENTQQIKKSPHLDPKKIPCRFIITKKYDGVLYGRYCNGLAINKKLCKNHINLSIEKCDNMSDSLCKHIITQKSRGLNRKGMICGDFTFDSSNKDYCKAHAKRHPPCGNHCLRSFKVRFIPTLDQRQKLNEYFGASRFTYNLATKDKVNGEFAINRDKYVTKIVNKHKFLSDTPKEIRAFALKDYIKNKNTAQKCYEQRKARDKYCRENYKNYKPRKIKRPEFKYQKRKDAQCITINKDAIKLSNRELKIYPQMFSDSPIQFISRSKKDKKFNSLLNGIIYHDVKIIKTKSGKYYMCFTVDVEKKAKRKDITVSANDTGCRTLITSYREYRIDEIGYDVTSKQNRMIELKKKLGREYKAKIRDLIKKKIEKPELEQAKIKYYRHREKMNNKIDDLHYKAIAKLLESSIILIPKLKINKIMRNKKLPNKVKSLLKMQSHSKLINRLQEKAEVEGCIVHIVEEYMTTKTCSNCFDINYPKESKTYKCNKCKLTIDRDINASRNIYIQGICKNIVDN